MYNLRQFEVCNVLSGAGDFCCTWWCLAGQHLTALIVVALARYLARLI